MLDRPKPDIKKFRLKHVLLPIMLVGSFLGIVLLIEMLMLSGHADYSIYLATTILFVIFGVLTFSKSQLVKQYAQMIAERSKVYTVVSTVLFGIVITALLGTYSNQIAQEQIDLTKRETSPSLSLERVDQNETISYCLTNSKGIASYISFSLEERYSFEYNNERCEIGLGFVAEPRDDKINLDSNNDRIDFVLEYNSFDREEAFRIVQDYVSEKNPEAIVSNTREITISFFDYKNQRVTFYYYEWSDDITLSSTSPQEHLFVKNNYAMRLRPDDDLNSTVEFLIDQVINRSREPEAER